jgi:hypothetical protein
VTFIALISDSTESAERESSASNTNPEQAD